MGFGGCMYTFIKFILMNVDLKELERVGWFGVLAQYSEDVWKKEDFEGMIEELKGFMVERFEE